MASLLFFLQLIVALVVLPLVPGLDRRYFAWGSAFLVVVVTVPAAAVVAVQGPRAAFKALIEVWSPVLLGPRSQPTAQAWALASQTFPAAGILAGLLALIGPLQNLDSTRPWVQQMLILAFFCLVWGLLGLLLGRILHQTSLRLTAAADRPLLVMTAEFAGRFGLTPRELEAAQAVLDGLTYQGTADKLSISPSTVKSHILNVYQKTGAGNKIELLRLVEADAERIHQSVDGPFAGPQRS